MRPQLILAVSFHIAYPSARSGFPSPRLARRVSWGLFTTAAMCSAACHRDPSTEAEVNRPHKGVEPKSQHRL